jgi:hypothetical protein
MADKMSATRSTARGADMPKSPDLDGNVAEQKDEPSAGANRPGNAVDRAPPLRHPAIIDAPAESYGKVWIIIGGQNLPKR